MSDKIVKVGMTPIIKSLKDLSFKKFKEGMNFNQYVKFIEERIEKENDFFEKNPNVNKVYRYKDLNNDQIEFLKKNFKRIELHFNNLSAKKYEDIKFKSKQKKNYNEKKNELINEYREKYLSELVDLIKLRHINDKHYSNWAYKHNLVHQYNCVVPGAYSRESLRKVVLNL